MKPVVHYKGYAVFINGRALLKPIDHPNHHPDHKVSNTQMVTTSPVQSYDKSRGLIETANTIYIREE